MSNASVPAYAPRHGGQILADALRVNDVDTIFGVPGESYLAVLEGLHRHQHESKFVICRQEGGAAFMADAYAKLTGKPGILMVTRGPGATNAAIGVHTAHQDSTPMVVIIGQIGADCRDREAFQEIDYRQFYGPITKWSAEIDQVERIPEYISQAMQRACSGRMGPVALSLPETMLTAVAQIADARPVTPVQASPSTAQMGALADKLRQAKNPIVLLGGSGWTEQACEQLAQFVGRHGLATACVFRRQDLLDNKHPCYVGDVGIGINPKLGSRLANADLILAIGPRLGEMTTAGYTLFNIPVPQIPMIHVHPGAEELGRVYQADLMINAGMPEFANALSQLSLGSSDWSKTTSADRAAYLNWQQRPPVIDTLAQDGQVKLDLWQVMKTLSEQLPARTILANGAGNFATWGHRFWCYEGLRTQLAPTSGAMGYGIPAAIAASITEPGRSVLCLAGDGDFLMTAQELATAAQYGATPLIIVFNNSMYGTIRMHQERDYPGNQIGTELQNPDFVALAKAYGGYGAKVESTDQFVASLAAALSNIAEQKTFALIELTVDPEMITPGRSMTEIRDGG